MLVGENWSILKEIVFIVKDFVVRKYRKATPLAQLRGLGERWDLPQWGLALGEDLAANDF